MLPLPFKGTSLAAVLSVDYSDAGGEAEGQ